MNRSQCIAALSVLAIGCAGAGPKVREPSTDSYASGERASISSRLEASSYLGRELSGASHSLFRGTYFKLYCKRSPGASGFELRTSEWASNGTWDTWRTALAAPFQVLSVTARHAGEIYVAGDGGKGTTIIERWELHPARGGTSVSRSQSATPLGIAAPYTDRPLVRLNGDTYVFAADRSAAPAPIRTRVYAGKDLDTIASMLVDPDGRFLLVYDRKQRLTQISLDGQGNTTLLMDGTSRPKLLESMFWLEARERYSPSGSTQARVVALRSLSHPSSACYLLHDAANDGRFESITELAMPVYCRTYKASPDWVAL